MKKVTIAEQIEVKPSGDIQVRFAKQRLNEEGSLDGEPQWHRAIFEVDTDIDAQMALINAHLNAMEEALVEVGCIDRIKAHAAVARTPELVAAKKAVRAAERQIADGRAMAAKEEQEKSRAARKAEIDAAVAEALLRA